MKDNKITTVNPIKTCDRGTKISLSVESFECCKQLIIDLTPAHNTSCESRFTIYNATPVFLNKIADAFKELALKISKKEQYLLWDVIQFQQILRYEVESGSAACCFDGTNVLYKAEECETATANWMGPFSKNKISNIIQKEITKFSTENFIIIYCKVEDDDFLFSLIRFSDSAPEARGYNDPPSWYSPTI